MNPRAPSDQPMAESEILSDDQRMQYEQQLLDAIPGTARVGNIRLRTQLGWSEWLYWFIRNRLIDAGRLEKGRGRGGSVRSILEAEPVQPAGPVRNARAISESALYEPILATIESQWVKDHQIQDHVAEITARQGRRDTGGRWSRPDIALASYNSYLYVPGKHFDVNTFEVKTHEGLDVTAVYEALAHRRAAHYSYLLVCVPDTAAEASSPLLDEIQDEADGHGIGFVVIANPATMRRGTPELSRFAMTPILRTSIVLSGRRRAMHLRGRSFTGAGSSRNPDRNDANRIYIRQRAIQ